MMKCLATVIGVTLAATGGVFPQERPVRDLFPSTPPVARTEVEKKILGTMDHRTALIGAASANRDTTG